MINFLFGVIVGVALTLASYSLRFLRHSKRIPVRVIERKILAQVPSGSATHIELELSDGRRFRTENGIVWYLFPSAERAGLETEQWLETEDERIRRLNYWSGVDKERR